MMQNNFSMFTAASRAAYQKMMLARHREDVRQFLKMPEGMTFFAVPTDSKFAIDIVDSGGVPYLVNVPKHLLNFGSHTCIWCIAGKWMILDRERFFSRLK